MRYCLALFAITAALAAPLLAEEPETATPRPKYPYPLPAWYEAHLKVLQTPVTLDKRDVPFTDVVAEIARACGKPIAIEVETSPERVWLGVRGLPAQSALKLLGELNKIYLAFDADRIIMTDTPARYPAPEHAALRARIERVRALADKTEQARPPLDMDGKAARAACKAVVAAFSCEFTSLPDALAKLARQTDAPVRAHHSANTFHRVTVSLKDATVEAIVDKLIEGSNSVKAYSDGILYVCSAAGAKQLAAETARWKAQIAQTKALMARDVGGDVGGLTIPEVVARLKTVTGKPVHAGPRAWSAPGKLASLGEKPDLGQLEAALTAVGVRLVPDLKTGELYLLATRD